MTLGALGQVLIQMRKNDLLGLAGQLAYFFLLSFFPFLIFLVSLVGSVVQAPQAEVEGLIQRTSGFIPADAVTLLVDYVDRTLRNAASSSLFFGILGTLFLGSMASVAIIQAANRAYELRETRPFWKVRGISILLALGFTLLVAALTLVVVQVEDYAGGPEGLPGAPDTLGSRPLDAGLFYRDPGSGRALLPGPRREVALQVDHTRRRLGRSPDVCRQRVV